MILPQPYSKSEMIDFLETKAWHFIGSKETGMLSFSHSHWRMNMYTTGTITIQDTNKRFDGGDIYRDIFTLEEISNIIKDYN